MNKTKVESTAHAVRMKIERGGTDRLWTYRDFEGMDRMALAAALSRLAKAGVLVRMRRGIYYRPKPTSFGLTRPTPEGLVDAALRARDTASISSGVGEYSRIGLTTQTSGVVSRATSRPYRGHPKGGIRVRATVRPLRLQSGITVEERTVLDAARDIRRIPGTRPASVLRRVLSLLNSKALDYERLARFALAEPPRVRALVGALGEELKVSRTARAETKKYFVKLKASLNDLTTFTIPGATEVLSSAGNWHIKSR